MPAPDQGSVYQSGECEIDLSRREIRTRGAPIALGARAFEIVERLALSAGGLVSKDELMNHVWPGAIVGDNTLQVHISAVRKALGPYRELLKTESGRGYRLLGSWTVQREQAPVQVARLEPALPAMAPSRTAFPEIVTNVIGRSAAAQRLQDLLSAYRLVTLTGPGGIGKTTLALVVARNMLTSFEEGGRLVELASLADPGLVAATVANVLGLRLSGEALSAETIARAIGERNLLLVLDNCEHVIEAAAKLTNAILRQCPRIVLLTTSREVLRVEGEYVYRVPPLDVPISDRADPDHILGQSAVELFVARVRALDSSFSPRTEILSSISTICRRLDGIPLAIEFAAARAATIDIPQLAAGLEDRFALLTAGRRTALPRHRTLRATLDWSYELLSPAEATVLRSLAVFAGEFSLEAAIAVVGNMPASSVINLIADLVGKSLVVVDINAASAWYRLLETNRVYAAEKLRESGELPQAARRHAEYYRDLLAPAETESESRPQADWLAIYGRHADNVRAGLVWAFSRDGDPRIGVALTIAAVPLWVQLSLLAECRERTEQALLSVESRSDEGARQRMQLSAALAWSLMYGVGRAREAGPAWTTTLELAERLDDTGYRLRALWGLCIDQFNNGEFRTAFDFAQRFADLATSSSDSVDLMMADRILATALHYLGDQQRARHHIDRTIAHLAAMADKPQIIRLRFDLRVSTHYFQARILWLQGLSEQSLRVVEHNIDEGRAIGHALTLCSVLGQGACPIAFFVGDLDAAARYGAMLLEHTERNPIRLWHLWARCFNGMLAAKRGDLAGGLTALSEALEQAGDARFLPRFLLLHGELASCLGAAGRVAEGLQVVKDSLQRCETRDEGWYVPELLRIEGELLMREGDARSMAMAEDAFQRSIDIAHRQGALSWELRAALSFARLKLQRQERADAHAGLSPVYARFTEGFDTADLKAAKTLLDTLT